MIIDRVSVERDGDGDWWLSFYADDIRHGYLVEDILNALTKRDTLPCDDCELEPGCIFQPFTRECEIQRHG